MNDVARVAILAFLTMGAINMWLVREWRKSLDSVFAEWRKSNEGYMALIDKLLEENSE